MEIKTSLKIGIFFLILISVFILVDTLYFDFKCIESTEKINKTFVEFCGDLTCQNEENFFNCKLDCLSIPIYQIVKGG